LSAGIDSGNPEIISAILSVAVTISSSTILQATTHCSLNSSNISNKSFLFTVHSNQASTALLICEPNSSALTLANACISSLVQGLISQDFNFSRNSGVIFQVISLVLSFVGFINLEISFSAKFVCSQAFFTLEPHLAKLANSQPIFHIASKFLAVSGFFSLKAE
jgi:hypothetical protein